MLQPPRAADLSISALGREGTSEGLKKGRFDRLTMRGPDGWRASGSALSIRGRSADAVLLGVQNADGEWVAIAAAPRSVRRDISPRARAWIGIFSRFSGPQKRGEWEIDLPSDTFGEQRSGVLRAWALDFRRHVLYQLPGDQEFGVISEKDRPL
jgi:hypothetical protein